MMLQIAQVLTPEEAQQCREALSAAQWVDGRQTAGHLAQQAKHNQQLAPGHKTAQALGSFVLDRLETNAAFIAAVLPLKVMPPMFNRYAGGGHYGNHVDNAIRQIPGTAHRVRTDVSCTLFLTDPADYDGGELTIEDTYGRHQVKLPAGHMVVYPGTSVHRVTPVTRGERVSAFFWAQSMVRDDQQRATLLELDTAIQGLTAKLPDDPALQQLSGVYHNLLRAWAEV